MIIGGNEGAADSDTRGISPVVGGALLLVIVIALSVTTAVMVLHLGDALQDPPPFVANEESAKTVIEGNDTIHTLEVSHQGGSKLDVDSIQIITGTGAGRSTIPLSQIDIPAVNDGTWETGETISVPLNDSQICSGSDGSSVSIKLKYQGRGSSYLLSSKTVPIEKGQFVIQGSTVKATTDYTANVKFVGTGWSAPSYDAPVNVTVFVGDSPVKAWTMVGDSQSVVGAYGISRQTGGTPIRVSAAGKTSPWTDEWVRVNSTSNTDNVKVYRNGDSAPSFSAGNGQQAVATYLDPYISDGTITLDENQAIYLFDFNSDEHDYQDAVVLVSFFAKQDQPGVYSTTGEDDVFICPAETKSASPNP